VPGQRCSHEQFHYVTESPGGLTSLEDLGALIDNEKNDPGLVASFLKLARDLNPVMTGIDMSSTTTAISRGLAAGVVATLPMRYGVPGAENLPR
jgi:hypothetical protein